MGETSGQQATFDGLTIKFTLKNPIQMGIFRVNVTNYPPVLRARRDMPNGLRLLIGQLFEQGAITGCSIAYGRRVDMRLAEQDQRGRTLLSNRRLEHFQAAFAKITGQQLATTWRDSGGTTRRQTSGGRDYGPLLEALVSVTSAVADGIQLAAAIEILSGDR